jgi:hypothetical protein
MKVTKTVSYAGKLQVILVYMNVKQIYHNTILG